MPPCGLADGAAVSAAELMAFVKAELGSVKAPKTIHFVAELPRNAAGKVSRAVGQGDGPGRRTEHPDIAAGSGGPSERERRRRPCDAGIHRSRDARRARATPGGVIAATGRSVDVPLCDADGLRDGRVAQLRNSNRRMRWESDPRRTFSPQTLSYLQII